MGNIIEMWKGNFVSTQNFDSSQRQLLLAIKIINIWIEFKVYKELSHITSFDPHNNHVQIQWPFH